MSTRKQTKKYSYNSGSSGLSKPKKSLGQNFLNDQKVVQDIVLCADLSPSDAVIEIGPGRGAMTGKLAERAGLVIAVEIDRDLIPCIEELANAYGNIIPLHADILTLDIEKDIIEKYVRPRGLSHVKVCANLPYYITTPIIMKFLEECPQLIDDMVIMVQKEVAERMTAAPGGKDYGAMTVTVNYFTEPRIAFIVPPRCFIPQPSVDSAVVRLKMRKEPPFELDDRDFFFKVVKAAFSQRRKTLANALGNSSTLSATSQQVAETLVAMGINPMARGETLSGQQFAALANRLLSV
ncbi:MAG: 16S rRNA (adenine(1518)-N(6)/adenine(1519)-N(6))-dimethyltransferase RsmA [Clostridia bacterium]|nr:16S rRNA (adenine(1518)-N(6)/adenine(1519)-N(6))-dimethyltransferase RsmA [Clostridia bacterium]